MSAKIQTLKLSLFIFLHFTPFTSYQTILTQIYSKQGLVQIAPISLGIIYFFYIVSTILAPASNSSLKSQLLLGGSCYTLTYAAGIAASFTEKEYLKYTITCIGSAIAGLSAGFLWVSIGRYVHLICQKYAQIEKKGELFGYTNTAYCLSYVSAGVIITFGLGLFDPRTYFYIATTMGIIATIYCLIFVDNVSQNDRALPANEKLLFASELKTAEFPPTSEQLSQMYRYSRFKLIQLTVMFIPRMYAVLLVMIQGGYLNGVHSDQISALLPSELEVGLFDKLTGVTTITLGVGAVIGSHFCGRALDKWGQLYFGRLNLIVWTITSICSVVGLLEPSIAMAQISIFGRGFSLSLMEGWLNTVCSRNYKGTAAAFSVNKQLHSCCYFMTQFGIFITNNNLPLIQMNVLFTFIAIPAFLLLKKVPNIQKQI